MTVKNNKLEAFLLLLALWLCVSVAKAQTLVQISDTLYNADGTKASGRLVVSWDPFTTSDNATIDGGNLAYTIPASGANAGKVILSLAPNVGATPSGTSYRIRYYLGSGVSYQENWVVPASGPVTIAQVRVLTTPIPIPTVNIAQVVGGAPGQCAQYSAGGVLGSAGAACGTGGGGGHTIQDEGTPLTARPSLNFSGGAIAASDDAANNRTNVTVSISDGDLPASITRDNEINVQGTNNEIVSSGSGPTPTLALASALNLAGKTLEGAAPLVLDGATANASKTTVAVTDPTASRIFTIPDADSVAVQPQTCSGTDKVGTISAAGVVTCAADQSGGGSAHNLLSATHPDTTAGTVARGDLVVGQGGTAAWQRLALGGANTFLGSNGTDAAWTAPSGGGPVLGTGRTLTGGAGIAAIGDLSADRAIATASDEADFLKSGALTCGAGAQGKMQVHTTPLQYCDNAATPALQYAAYGDSSGTALSGDSATTFFGAGQIEAARGGTGEDSSGSSGVPKVVTGTWSFNAGIGDLAASTSANLASVLSDETGSGKAVFDTAPTFQTSITTPVMNSAAADAADTGAIRLANNEVIGWEASPAGTDLTLQMDANNVLTSSAPINATSGFRIGNAAASGKILIGNGTDFVASTPSYPNASATAGKYIKSDGTNFIASSGSASGTGSCTNQAVTALNSDAAPSCTTLTSAYVDTTIVTNSNTNTLTNKTLDAEATGNVISQPAKVEFVAAGCDNTTAASAFDLPTSGGPSKSCYGSSPHRFGALDFADGAAALSASLRYLLPSDWTPTGGVDIKFVWFSSSTSTNSVVWTVQTACVADGEDVLNPAYNATQPLADANNATANTRNSASIAGITMTGCAAGETLYLKVGRDPTNASDTLAATASLQSAELTLRRSM